MLFTIFSVFYVLIAAAMIVLILMQRGDGANAGASFGGGASGTVFGARGAASFLTRTTGVLAGLLFVLSLAMGIYLSHNGAAMQTSKQTLGVMAGAGSSAPAASAPAASAPGSGAPAQQSEVPVVSSAPANAEVPTASAPAASAPAASH